MVAALHFAFAPQENAIALIIIQRCSVSPRIRIRAQEVKATLMRDFGRFASIRDGAINEFAILVDGLPMIQRTDSCLPSMEEVESAIQNSEETPLRCGLAS